jgi:FAD/FMN-containing dehydrogenase
VAAVYGPNLERLSQIKKRYDPDNFFRVNQNIKPST